MFRELRQLARESVKHYAGLASVGHAAGLVFKQLDHPLRQIRSDLSLALGDIRSVPMDDDDRNDLARSVTQALQHVDTTMARIEKLDPLAIGGRGRRLSPVVMKETLEPVVHTFAQEADRLGVSIHLEGAAKLELITNREVVQHSLSNLLDNAIWWASREDASSPVVRIRVTPTGFSISDNGPGIPDDHRSLIYEPGFSTREGAHGLGLTLVRDLLETIGGSVRLAKIRPARFVVRVIGELSKR